MSMFTLCLNETSQSEKFLYLNNKIQINTYGEERKVDGDDVLSNETENHKQEVLKAGKD